MHCEHQTVHEVNVKVQVEVSAEGLPDVWYYNFAMKQTGNLLFGTHIDCILMSVSTNFDGPTASERQSCECH